VSSTGVAIGPDPGDFRSDPETLRVLLVEDNPLDAELTLSELRREGFEVSGDIVETIEDFTRHVRTHSYQVILADYNLPQWRGIEALDVLQREGLDIPLILVSGALGDVNAVECIKQGATDYVLKDSLARLAVSVRRALQEKRQRDERLRAEKRLANKAAELARSNQDLEQFAYVASHDLQEPLRMVAAYTQLLAERYRGKLDADADKYIGYAVEGALRMQTLVRDMLAFSRVGRNGIGSSHSDCNSIVQEALLNLKAAIEESGAVVTLDNLPTIQAERTQLVQLFQNLIGNAIKFRRKEPLIIRVFAEPQGSFWQFTVADNGIGIAPEYKDLIFVIFQRLNTREEYSGNGVGLAICKKIVERYGGKIWIESKPGQGCTFYFTLPAPSADESDNHVAGQT
jgi:signal transduction histidine kinase